MIRCIQAREELAVLRFKLGMDPPPAPAFTSPLVNWLEELIKTKEELAVLRFKDGEGKVQDYIHTPPPLKRARAFYVSREEEGEENPFPSPAVYQEKPPLTSPDDPGKKEYLKMLEKGSTSIPSEALHHPAFFEAVREFRGGNMEFDCKCTAMRGRKHKATVGFEGRFVIHHPLSSGETKTLPIPGGRNGCVPPGFEDKSRSVLVGGMVGQVTSRNKVF